MAAKSPSKYLDPKVLERIKRLDVRARLVVEGFITGQHESPYQGFAIEFAGHREYAPGDEIKHIDWKLWSKTDRLYIKEYEEETNLKCNVLLDCSKSMTYGDKDHWSKFDYAATAAASLTYLLQQQQDAVGLVTFNTDVCDTLPPSSSPAHLKRILHVLEETAVDDRTDVDAVFPKLTAQIRSRGIIAIFSDFFVDLDTLTRMVREFRLRRNEVILFHVMHDHELTFPFQDNTLFRGLETDAQLQTQPRELQKSYLEVVNRYLDRVRKICGDAGADHVLLNTADPLDAVLAGYFSFRQRNRRKIPEASMMPLQLIGALVSPGLLGLGAGLMALPIIIHLLNKRKFKIVDWAAMDFLLEADKLNRRRIKLEDLLILLMRCLAVLLLGLLVARPFFSDNPFGGLLGGARYERYVLLDDSLSMAARDGGTSLMDRAKQNLERWLVELSAGSNDESLTLVLASQPDRPIFNGVPLNAESVSEIADRLKRVNATARKVNLVAALQSLETNLTSQEDSVNRIVYFLTDARVRDWTAGGSGTDPLSAAMAKVAKQANDIFLVDFSGDDHGNLSVVSVKASDKALIAGVPTRFDIEVHNHGRSDAESVQIEFGARDVLPMKQAIDRIPAGGSVSIPFTYTFAPPEDQARSAVSVPLLARIRPAGDSTADRLESDNAYYFAARVLTGIPTLLVDGDPSADFAASETFFARKALSPRGSMKSGIAVKVVSETEFETLSLDPFQVIYLCNLYRVSDERLDSLKEWVAGGGGLVFALGDQVDGETYRRLFHEEGKGLFPLDLTGTQGDEREQQWVNLQGRNPRHPVMQVFEGDASPLLESVKVFRWWGSAIPESVAESARVDVLASLTDPAQSPAIVESVYGEGRVVVFTLPLDIDWASWPREAASFLITLQEFTRYLAPSTAGRYVVDAGEAITLPVDLVRYRSDIELKTPGGEARGVQARQGEDASATIWTATFPEADDQGFYTFTLTRNEDGLGEELLYAANIDAGEGALQPMERPGLLRLLEGSGVEVVEEVKLAGVTIESAQSEWWPYVLIALVLLLITEQKFACYLGAKR